MFFLLRSKYKIAATATINSTRRTTATGTNNTGQRVGEEMGLVPGGLTEGEGKALPEGLVEAATGTNNTGVGEEMGLVFGGLAEGEGKALPGRLVEAAERLRVIPMKAMHQIST